VTRIRSGDVALANRAQTVALKRVPRSGRPWREPSLTT